MSKIKIVQTRSTIGATPSQRATLRSLGLRRISSSVTHDSVPEIMGQVNKVSHLVTVSDVTSSAKSKKDK